ncbi:NVEALA domain-containing protein [Bacteroides eggerthii]|uniref:NVEALA domain-containing protein n=1 Tax=Bacteroides eggerthii TaxID=28111 RepID=UPI00356505F2
MKTKLLIVGSLLMVVTATYFYVNSEKSELSDLLLKNVEALADNEYDSTVSCLGRGSVDCPHTNVKVKYVMGGYSLEDLY